MTTDRWLSRAFWRTLVVTLLVGGIGCGGDVYSPVAPTGPIAVVTGTMTVTSALSPTGGYRYTVQIELTESAGVAATDIHVSVAFSDAFGWEPGQSFFGPEAWPGTNAVPPNGRATSNPLVVEEELPPAYRNTVFAEVMFNNGSQHGAQSFIIRGTSPPMPDPPAGARFALTGRIEQPPFFVPSAGATVEVTQGEDSGRKTTTDADGRFTLSGLRTGTVTVRISKPGYQSGLSTVELKSNRTITHRLEPS